jgi:hypothetical protein
MLSKEEYTMVNRLADEVRATLISISKFLKK